MIKRTYCCCAIFLLLLSVNRAEAHPHVWVTFHSELLYATFANKILVKCP
jgi:hypothetical protein